MIALQIDGDLRHGVRDAFIVTAAQIKCVVDENWEARPVDWTWQIERLIGKLVHALLGLPYDADESS